MKPLFTQEEYDSVRYQDRLPCECYQCGHSFMALKHDISRFLKRGQKVAMFCNNSCKSKHKALNDFKQCHKCLKNFNLIVINKHIEACGNNKRKYSRRKYKEERIMCHICNKEFNKYGIGTHIYMKHEGNAKRLSKNRINKFVPTNQYIKAKQTGIPYVLSDEIRAKISQSSAGRKHSEESKNKIRIHQIKYYQNNPDKIPFKLYDYSKKSYPEKVFEENLTGNTIFNFGKYETELQFNIYNFDFAWTDLKIDVEIDGDFHNKPNRVTRDNLRNEYCLQQGWTIIRFEAKLIIKHPKYCIQKLKNIFENFVKYKNQLIKYTYSDFIKEKASLN